MYLNEDTETQTALIPYGAILYECLLGVAVY